MSDNMSYVVVPATTPCWQVDFYRDDEEPETHRVGFAYILVVAWRIPSDAHGFAEQVTPEGRHNNPLALYYNGPEGPVWLFAGTTYFRTLNEACEHADELLRDSGEP